MRALMRRRRGMRRGDHHSHIDGDASNRGGGEAETTGLPAAEILSPGALTRRGRPPSSQKERNNR